MFTGIITDVGVVRRIERRGDLRLEIATAYDTGGIDIGASIACSGACLTVVETGADWFAVDVSAESLSKTTIGRWDIGSRINLERALALGDELGGHLVSGHVDGLAVLEAVEPEGDSRRLTIRAPDDLARFVAPKGSVTLDGISLTVNEVSGSHFGINIIPHTWDRTSLSERGTGDALHMEVDLIARYVARLLEAGSGFPGRN